MKFRLTTHKIKAASYFYRFAELAAVIDWGNPIVSATYSLEGDGPL